MAVLLSLFAYRLTSVDLHADEVDDLIQRILEVSPTQRAAVKKHKPPQAKKAQTPKSPVKKKTIVPDLGIPESQLLDAAAKFPKDFRGKYIYGRVVFRGVSTEYAGERAIFLFAKNGRSFDLYTKDEALIAFFSSLPWKTEFDIPRECPLRIVDKGWFTYVVRMPYDTSNSTGFSLKSEGESKPVSKSLRRLFALNCVDLELCGVYCSDS